MFISTQQYLVPFHHDVMGGPGMLESDDFRTNDRRQRHNRYEQKIDAA